MRTRTSLATLGLLALTACGGGGAEAEPEPILPSSSAPSPEPSASTTEDAPEAPPSASRNDRGVRTFLDYWAEVITFSLNSGETQALQAISAPNCESCNSVVDLITDVYEDGGRISNGGWTVRSVAFGSELDRPLAVFDRGREVVRRTGQSAERFPADESTIDFELRWTEGEWRVEQFTIKA